MATEIKIRHRRLHAFFNSKVICSLMIAVEVCILLMPLFNDIMFPVVCCGFLFACITGYSLWLWLKKPISVVLNSWLSDICGAYTIYFLIATAIKNASIWWYLFGGVSAIMIFFISLIKSKDEVFEI